MTRPSARGDLDDVELVRLVLAGYLFVRLHARFNGS